MNKLLKSVLEKITVFGNKSGLFNSLTTPKDMVVERLVDGANYTDKELKYVKKNWDIISKEVSKLF